MVVNERQDDWHAHLSHVECAHKNSISAATGLAPNEVHIWAGSQTSPSFFSTAPGSPAMRACRRP